VLGPSGDGGMAKVAEVHVDALTRRGGDQYFSVHTRSHVVAENGEATLCYPAIAWRWDFALHPLGLQREVSEDEKILEEIDREELRRRKQRGDAPFSPWTYKEEDRPPGAGDE